MDRNVLVTGGCGGVGHAVTTAVDLAGGRAIVIDTDPSADVVVDVRDRGALVTAIEDVYDGVDRLDLVVNATGVGANGQRAPVGASDWNRHRDTLVAGVYHTCGVVGSRMAGHGGGTIVNLAPDEAWRPGQRPAWHHTVKTGLVLLTRSLGVDFRGTGVRVNAVCVGGLDAPALLGCVDERADAELTAHLRTRRRPPAPNVTDELVDAVLFVADLGDRIRTGSTVVVHRVLSTRRNVGFLGEF